MVTPIYEGDTDPPIGNVECLAGHTIAQFHEPISEPLFWSIFNCGARFLIRTPDGLVKSAEILHFNTREECQPKHPAEGEKVLAKVRGFTGVWFAHYYPQIDDWRFDHLRGVGHIVDQWWPLPITED